MIFAVSGVQGQAKTKKTGQMEWHPHPPTICLFPVWFNAWPVCVASDSLIRRFTLNWHESSKKPFSRYDGCDGKNYERQERIFPLFHSIEPRREEMSVRGPSMWNQTGRLWTKVISCSHQVRFCVFSAPAAWGSLPRRPTSCVTCSWWQTCLLPGGRAHRRIRAHSERLLWTGDYKHSRKSAFTFSSLLTPSRFCFSSFEPFHCTGLNWIWTVFKLLLYSQLLKSLWKEIRKGFHRWSRCGQQPGCTAMMGALVCKHWAE